ALGISRSGGARNPHVFQYTLRFLRSGGTRPSFARDGFSQTLRKRIARMLTVTRIARESARRIGIPSRLRNGRALDQSFPLCSAVAELLNLARKPMTAVGVVGCIF
ncbi:MAG: hypothetical protein ACREYE_18515, partial [Gammaproteobacteria bacterium]